MATNSPKKAIVYALTNPCMQGIVKIGHTTRSVRKRIKDLDTTAVPVPFECLYAVAVKDKESARKIEKLLHQGLKDLVSKQKEFFAMTPESACSLFEIIEMLGGKKVEPDYDPNPRQTPNTSSPLEEERYVGKLDSARQPHSKDARKGFNGFTELGIKEGAVLELKGYPNITCVVVDDKRVSYGGEDMSLTGAAKRAKRSQGWSGRAISGPQYWMFNGKSVGSIGRKHQGQVSPRARIPTEEKQMIGKLDSSLQPVWFKLREKLSKLADASFNVNMQSRYISFRKQGKVVCYINFQEKKRRLRIAVNRGKQQPDGRRSKEFFTMPNDPKGICKENTWQWNDGTKGCEYVWFVSDTKNLNYTVRLIKQKYDHMSS